MKNKLITFYLLIISFCHCYAQNSLKFDFAGAFHNSDHYGLMESFQMTTDYIGNHYVTCRFDGIHDVDPSSNESLIEVLDGNHKIFFGKYSPTGQLIWKKTTLLNVTAEIIEINTDQNGNIYLSGRCTDSIDLGFDGTQINHSTGQNTHFLAKYSPNGSLIWYKSFKAKFFHFNLNSDDELIAVCTYNNNIDIGFSGNHQLITGAANNILLMKFDSNGDVLWSKSSEINSYPSELTIGGIDSDGSGNIFITGVFSGLFDADLDSGTHTLNTSYGINSYYVGIYFCKYTTDGSLVWAEMSTGDGWVAIESFKMNNMGEFAIMGRFAYDRDFDVTSGATELTGLSSANNYFLVKYNPSCGLVYANKLTSSFSNQFISALAISEDGHCNILGRKAYNIYTLGDTATYGIGFENKSDLIRLEFDSLGNVIQENFFEITLNPVDENYSLGYAISLGSDGNPVILGEVGKYVDMDQTSSNLHAPATNTYFLASFLHTGELNWCSFIGRNTNIIHANETTTGIVFDEQGGCFLTGIYKQQQVDLDLMTDTLYTDLGGMVGSAYLCHYNSENELTWSRSFTGNNVIASIALPPLLDSDNNVLVPMHYSGNLAFNTPLNNYIDTLTGQSIRFGLFKFDDSGGLIWAKKIFTEIIGSASVTDVELNENNEIFVTGSFTDTVFFKLQGIDTMLVSNNGSEDIFVARLDMAGDVIWLRSIGGLGIDRSFQILPDGANNFYLSGVFYGSANLNLSGGINNYTSLHSQATFFARYFNTGNVEYVKMLNSTYFLNINEFKKDYAGNLILAGSFKGTLDCDPSSSSFYLTTNNLHSFIGKYSGSGQFNWAKSFENYSTNEISSFIVDSMDNILAGGFFYGDIQFSINPNIHRTAIAGTRNIFLVYFNANGQINNVFSFGPLSTEDITHIAYKDGMIGITGGINEIGIDFDPSAAEHKIRSYNYADGYLVKYELCTFPQVSILWNFITMTASVNGAEYQWMDGLTNEPIPGETQQSFTPIEDGSYYVVISTDDGCIGSSYNLDIVNLGLEVSKKGQITVCPNPTSSVVTIKIESPADNYFVSVYSISGANILTQNLMGNSTHELDLSNCPQGVYLIRLNSQNESQVFKIIKN